MQARMVQDGINISNNIRRYLNPMKKLHLAGGTYPSIIALNVKDDPRKDAHEIKKVMVAMQLIREGRTIATEAVLKNGKRPDIIVMDLPNPIVYEILSSESREHALAKDYMGMKIETVKA